MSSHRFDGFTKINSGHIDGAQYNAIDHKMRVRYQNGYVYEVHGISSEAYQDFMGAPSQGEHWHAHIKDNYHVVRVR
jgi:hypothetical protein